jgi:hypothetical protein
MSKKTGCDCEEEYENDEVESIKTVFCEYCRKYDWQIKLEKAEARIKELELMTTPIGCASCEMKSDRIEELEAELKAETQAKFRIMGQIADMMGYKPR